MRRLALFSVLMLGCAASASPANAKAPAVDPARAAAPTAELTAEDLVDMKTVSGVAISPDGRQVAYVLRTPRSPMDEPGRARNIIWLVSSKGGEPRRMSAPDMSSSSPHWSPDGKWLAFRSGRPSSDGTQVFRISPTGGEPEQLTKVEGGVGAYAWSPDGKSVAYLANRVESDEEKADKEKGRDWRTTDVVGKSRRLWVLGLASHKATAVTGPDFHIEHFEWSPDGESFLVQASERADIDAVMMYSGLYVTGAAGLAKGWRKLVSTAGKLGDLEWSPKGDQIAYLGAKDIHDPTAGILFVVPAAGGNARALSASSPFTGQAIRWVGDDRIVMLANEGTRTTMYAVSPAKATLKALRREGPICRGMDVDKRAKTVVCAGSTGKHPAEVFAGSLRGGALKRLTNHNPDLATKRLGEQSVVRWKAADGLEIEGVIVKPVGYEAGKNYPLAVLVHGGPEGISLDGWNSGALYPAQLFATRGFAVLMPNYRGSQGRGVDFGKADQGDLGGKEFEDVLAGIDHLAAQGLVDATRVGMGGWSYGGYFSGLAATMYSERFKAAVVAAAITNWISFTGTSEIEHENSLVHWNLWPYDNLELAWSRSPMAHIGKSKTATMVVHGDADTRVPPEQATELYRGLRHFNRDTSIVLYPREGHGLGERAHQLDFAERFVAWFETHVKG